MYPYIIILGTLNHVFGILIEINWYTDIYNKCQQIRSWYQPGYTVLAHLDITTPLTTNIALWIMLITVLPYLKLTIFFT